MLPRVAYKSSSSEFEDLLKGQYELVEKVGKGSYGDVYRALEVSTQRYIAIKRTRHHSDGGVRCVLEPILMRSLSHPYLLHAENVLVGETMTCVVMPLALDDVGHYLQRYPRTSLSQRLQWCWQLCQAVACLHQVGVIHGDVKDANCLIMPDMRCVLADFTLSVLCPVAHQHSHMVYTFTHRPPELFMYKSWSYPADAWALGCTLYEIIYQTPLFPYQSDGTRHLDDERPLYTKALACFRQFGMDTHQTDPAIQTALLGKRTGKWLPSTASFNDSVEYEGINNVIKGLLRLVPSDRLTLPEVLAHPAWDVKSYPLHGYMYRTLKSSLKSTSWIHSIALLPPPAEAWLDHLKVWSETWNQSPPKEPGRWVWAALCVLMKMTHVSLYCAPPAELKEVQKTEKNVLAAAGWTIPWKKWSVGVPMGSGVRAASPRPLSPPPPESPSPQGHTILPPEMPQESM
jgi:serine/threonine protein kinase